jgi:urease accessory protein
MSDTLDAMQLLTLLQWTDSAFPTGAFAHSNALETATQHEQVVSTDDLQSFIRAKLTHLANNDLIMVHQALLAYQHDDSANINLLDEWCGASKMAQEARQASQKIGRRMLDNIVALHPDPRLLAYRESLTPTHGGHHAVVHGLACGYLGVSAHTALLAFAYGVVANQTSAALKLMSIGQTQTQAILHQLQSAMIQSVDHALTLTLDDFGGFSPLLDIYAMQHAHLFRRLFIS